VRSIWYHEPTIETVQKRSQNTLVQHLAITFTEIGDDYLKAQMPVDERTQQYMGLLHGGASCALGETVGSVGANFCIVPEYAAVGIDINANHLRAVRSGHVEATSWPWHLGKQSQVWHIEVHDHHNRLASVQRLTLSIIQRATT